ncbi:Lrp/AsnC family transcriptional regulator, leucine-responsive regulatory protein [Rhizobium mongolense subsp. loessense]|uniref:Lrp/AsnC family transcriptional regulator, leucine-responsive regulatory protein n=1 Tax=Rhizobium mongolense subsp. loessense TaxID=158890 RepID=A0A1G4R9V9_9HYPH|nr:Lrp/AsnC family transcriptional regulator, leucine-responsive regulatory protein [Rhizobium mongolense subsp. loessense]
MVKGGFDFLVKARVAGMEAHRAISLRSDSAAARRAQAHTYAVEEETKPARLLPV